MFSLGVAFAMPLLSPIVTSVPGLGTVMRPLSYIGNNVSFTNRLVNRIWKFGYEEGFQEIIPGWIGGKFLPHHASEVFQELFDKTPNINISKSFNTVSSKLTQNKVNQQSINNVQTQNDFNDLAVQSGIDVEKVNIDNITPAGDWTPEEVTAGIVLGQAIQSDMVDARYDVSAIRENLVSIANDPVMANLSFDAKVDFLFGAAGVLASGNFEDGSRTLYGFAYW